ncbi:hypothetical protein OBBRIDRAFT_744674 [Obba rivulosa]|uniref:Pentatricopeptide repeat-containing protein n=1 Tax=Obba rivulosa TaxID=1052685 RepID=A0A8E2J6L5_9APHY|nr:hypothetical protein OBBRIDRAFT_744674 [Obba rivulosa]
MLEPLTATLLASRQCTIIGPSSHSALRALGITVSAVFPHDYFTPRPRCAKGKERALPEDFGGEYANRETAHTSTCSSTGTKAKASSVAPRHRSRRAAHRKHANVPPRGLSFSACPPHWDRLTQRRHMSSTSNLPGPSTSSTVDYESAEQTVVQYAQWAHGIDAVKAWDGYDALPTSHRRKIPREVLMDFTCRLLAEIEPRTIEDLDLSVWENWAPKVNALLQDTALGLQPLSSEDFRHRCLAVRYRALDGKLDVYSALLAMRDIVKQADDDKDQAYLLQTWTTVIRSLHWYGNVESALSFIMQNWDHVGTYLCSDGWRYRARVRSIPTPSGDVDSSLLCLRATGYDICSRLENVGAYLASVQERWTPEQKQSVGAFLATAFCHYRMPEDAVIILDKLQEQSLKVSASLQLQIVKALVKDDKFERANTIFTSIREQSGRSTLFKAYVQTGLYLYAHQGDTSRAEEYFDFIVRERWVRPHDLTMIMHAYAVSGDPERVVNLFREFFPDDPLSERQPSIHHYSTVILAYARVGDYGHMNRWLGRMTDAGHTPDDYVYSIIMQSFAMRGDAANLAALLKQLRDSGKPPTQHTYTTLISLLASRGDSMAAEDIYARAIWEGIVPDRRMVTALMNAHVEAGSWAGVVRAFDYMKSSKVRGIRLGLEVYNTLLKAYIRIGAPFRVVAKLFQRLDEVGVRPDQYSFALLIQSACDSGLMNVAEDIFAEMRRLVDDWQSNLHINVYILTILMGGYLRKGLKHRARAMFAYMKVNKMQPSAVTYGTIIRTYARDSTDLGLKAASDFLTSLLEGPDRKPWMHMPGKRTMGLEHVFGPLMIAYSWRADPVEVERYFKEMLEHGGEPSIVSLTSLLDAYRRMGDTEKVKSIWPQIFELGLQHAGINLMLQKGETTLPTLPAIRNTGSVLCIPLSIYIDAMSAAGQHVEIANVWHRLKDAGFAFDAHNWNHLVVALVRAGEPERAFEIVERVILAYARKIRKSFLTDRDKSPSSPLIAFEEDDLPPAPNNSPFRSRTKRYKRVRLFTKKSDPTDEQTNPDDFAHPLHILHQISPLWNVWRPHTVTVELLLDVLEQLRTGNIIQPHIPGQETLRVDPAEVDERRQQARQTLSRIHENYPDTVQYVKKWKYIQAGKAAKYFGRKYEALQRESDDRYIRQGALDF